jgi:SET domain-containing protein
MNRLAVRPSRIHGRGVFAVSTLPQRRKLGEIQGELVRLPQARRAAERQAKIYLIELNRRWALDCSTERPFKYLNHSCRPNCYLRIYRKRVEVYTLRRIVAGTELTVDYGLTPHKNGMACLCGSARCKKRL